MHEAFQSTYCPFLRKSIMVMTDSDSEERDAHQLIFLMKNTRDNQTSCSQFFFKKLLVYATDNKI